MTKSASCEKIVVCLIKIVLHFEIVHTRGTPELPETTPGKKESTLLAMDGVCDKSVLLTTAHSEAYNCTRRFTIPFSGTFCALEEYPKLNELSLDGTWFNLLS